MLVVAAGLAVGQKVLQRPSGPEGESPLGSQVVTSPTVFLVNAVRSTQPTGAAGPEAYDVPAATDALFSALEDGGALVDRTVLGGALHRWLTGDRPTRDEHLEVPPAPPGAYAWAGGGLGGEPPAVAGGGGLLAIAHRLGPPEAAGANTLAAYRRARELGFRIFEVDLTLTADGVLVCHHGRPDEVLDTLTWEGYRGRSGRAACRFADLVAEARADPEIRFVLDVKNRFDDAYDRIRAEIGEDGPGGSFIPQIYHFGQASHFRSDPFFAGILFTAYRSALPLEDVFEYARRTGIEVVTLPVERMAGWRGPLPDTPLVLVHPVNDAGLALRLRAREIDGIYTAHFSPPILRRWTDDPP